MKNIVSAVQADCSSFLSGQVDRDSLHHDDDSGDDHDVDIQDDEDGDDHDVDIQDDDDGDDHDVEIQGTRVWLDNGQSCPILLPKFIFQK